MTFLGGATIRYMAGSGVGVAVRLYERVERERALKGWSWTRLQRETGVARSTFAKWQTQPQPPQPATVNAVADALGIGRAEALELAGILIEDVGDPECTFERSIQQEEKLSAADKRTVIRAHRAWGHVHCRPLEQREQEQVVQQAAGLLRA